MRGLISIVVLAGAAVIAVPYVDGYLAKKSYMREIALIQNKFQHDKNVQVQFGDYHLGWLSSTTTVTLTIQADPQSKGFPVPPVVFHVALNMLHGPIVHDQSQDKYKLALGQLEAIVAVPDILQGMVDLKGQDFLKLTSLLSIDGKTWNNHYQIPALTIAGVAQWAGLSGDFEIDSTPLKIQGKQTFGAISIPKIPSLPFLPQVSVAEFQSSMDAVMDASGFWNGSSTAKTTAINVTPADGGTLNVNQLAINAAYGAESNLYHYKWQLTLASLEVPPPILVTNFSNIKYSMDINNLDAAGMQNYVKQFHAHEAMQDKSKLFSSIMQAVTPQTNIAMNFSVNTPLGASTANLQSTLQSVPKNLGELDKNIDLQLNARAAVPLVEKLVESYLAANPDQSQSALPVSDSPQAQQTPPVDPYKQLIANMLQAGKVNLSGSLALIGFSDQHLTMADFQTQLKKLKLDPDTSALLEQAYMRFLASNTATPTAVVLTPAEQAQQLIDAWISQGFIVKDKEDYVLTLIKKGENVNINGNDVSAQYVAFIQEGLQDAPTVPKATAAQVPVSPEKALQ